MVEERVTIRLRYEPTGNRYQVVRQGKIVSDHPTKEAAAIAIRDLGCRVAATWQRTDFGYGPLHADFCATILGEGIGRIMKLQHGPSQGAWTWAMNAHRNIDAFKMALNGHSGSKQEAARMVEWAYTQCVKDRRREE